MHPLTDLLSEAAGESSVGFTPEDVRHRVVRRRRSRRARRLGSLAAVTFAASLAAATNPPWSADGGDDLTATVNVGADQVVGFWQVQTVGDHVVGEEYVWITLEADGTIRGWGLCDAVLDGRWALKAGHLVVELEGLPAEDSEASCPEPGSAGIDRRMVEVLVGRPAVVSDSSTPMHVLRLTGPDGTVVDLARTVPLVAGPTLQSRLLDGRPWALTDSPERGLCVVLGAGDLGCDGGVSGADRAAPRTAADGSGLAFAEDEAAALMYGYLPPGAVNVRLLHDDGREEEKGIGVIDSGNGIWAMAVRPGDNPDVVVFLGAGTDGPAEPPEIARHRVGG